MACHGITAVFERRIGRRNTGRTKLSAGCWLGEDKPKVEVIVRLVGNQHFVAPMIAGFEKDMPRVSPPTLAMCLRAAAWYVDSPLSKYLPAKHARDFLPFLQVEGCSWVNRSKFVTRSFQRILSDKRSKNSRRRQATEPIDRRVLSKWQLSAKIIFAHFPGVNEANVRELIAAAGAKIGLGMFRPELGGNFGTFSLDEMTVVSGTWFDTSDETEEDVSVAAKEVQRVIGRVSAEGAGLKYGEEADDDEPDNSPSGEGEEEGDAEVA